MDELTSPEVPGANMPPNKEVFQVYPDVASFAEAIKATTGLALDLKSVLELTTDFIQVTSQYMLLNVKEYDSKEPDNLLFLMEDNVYVCSKNAPSPASVNVFEDVLQKSFGKSTIVAFLVISQVLDNHIQKLESLNKSIRALESNFDQSSGRYKNTEDSGETQAS